jgi:diacylglycerol kinase family enzyme
VPRHPVLIVNPRSGNGRAAAIDLVPAAQRLGIETVTMQPGDDVAELASSLVDEGCDHLMMAGGDGSLAIVAAVAMAHDVPFSCVPVGTRNHFAMDLGLDRSHPLRSLDAAVDGSERVIDVGIVAGRVFLNNVSFGLYPRAIADPDYRSHRARSMADATVATVDHLETRIAFTAPDGRVVSDVEVLLASNNPYRFIGPPDFGGRPALDTGALGIVVADRPSRLKRGPAAFTRLEAQTLTVHSDPANIQVGVDGELMHFRAPIELAIAPKSLRVLTPRQTQSRSLKESIQQLNERALVHLSGLPTLPRPTVPDSKSSMLSRLDEIDEAVFQRIAGWESPAMDRVMPALSQAASHSKIWIAMAAAMSLVGGKKGRRTAVEGLAAVAVTSFLANLVAKRLFRRRRPTDQVPEARRLATPSSSSMPSGHTASAAAFTRVVSASYPGLRIPLDTLAAAIGFSRVYTGVHHPTDVLAGWLLGRGIGTLSHSTAAVAGAIRHSAARCRARRIRRS